MNIEIVYGDTKSQTLLIANVPEHTTINSALQQSVPELINENLSVGIFGQTANLDYILQENDRIEIYQPLKIDPKEARRARVKPFRRKY